LDARIDIGLQHLEIFSLDLFGERRVIHVPERKVLVQGGPGLRVAAG
jgi:hypothetical protein